MQPVTIIWDDTEGGNVEHVAQHGVTLEEVNDVLQSRGTQFDRSRSSGQPIAFGYTRTGRYLAVVFEEVDETTAYPLTAYDAPEPGV